MGILLLLGVRGFLLVVIKDCMSVYSIIWREVYLEVCYDWSGDSLELIVYLIFVIFCY